MDGRKYRSTIPEVAHTTQPQSNEYTRNRLQEKQRIGARYFNRSVKEKAELKPGQSVRVRNLKYKTWEPATITGVADTPRSYIVQRLEGGAPLRRNRIHLKPTIERWKNGTTQHNNTNKNNNSKTTSLYNNLMGRGSGGTNQESEMFTKRTRRQTSFYQA